jgi:hypothetical protein
VTLLYATIAAVALAIVVAGFDHGPGAVVREALRSALPVCVSAALDCVVCLSAWTGALCGVAAWVWSGDPVAILTPAAAVCLAWGMEGRR